MIANKVKLYDRDYTYIDAEIHKESLNLVKGDVVQVDVHKIVREDGASRSIECVFTFKVNKRKDRLILSLGKRGKLLKLDGGEYIYYSIRGVTRITKQ